MKTKLVIQKDNGFTMEADALNILKKIYTNCNDLIVNSQDLAPVNHGNGAEAGKMFTITRRKHWASIAKHLYRNSDRPGNQDATPLNQKFKYAYVKIGNDNENIVRIFCGETRQGAPNQQYWLDKRIVEFPTNLGSYEEITISIRNVLFDLSGDNKHVDLASALIDKIKKPSNDYSNNILNANYKLLNCLLVLICIVEPSRHSAMLAYAMMILHLIKNSPNRITTRNFNWNNVFVSENSYKWDDFERRDYGGKYPGASNSTGSGNYTEAGKMLRGIAPYNGNYSSDNVLKERQHHMVILRGMKLTLYWLMIFKPDSFKNNINNANELLNHIENLIKKRLKGIFSKNTTYPSHMKFKATINHIGNLPQNPLVEPNNDDLCYFFRHKAVVTNDPNNIGHIIGRYFHRNNSSCKLIPEYIRNESTKSDVYLAPGKKINATAQERMSRVSKAKEIYGLTHCPCCYKQSHINRANPPMIIAYRNNSNRFHKTVVGGAEFCYQDFFSQTVKTSFFSTVPVGKNGQPRTPCQENCCWPVPNGLPPEQPIPDRLKITL